MPTHSAPAPPVSGWPWAADAGAALELAQQLEGRSRSDRRGVKPGCPCQPASAACALRTSWSVATGLTR